MNQLEHNILPRKTTKSPPSFKPQSSTSSTKKSISSTKAKRSPSSAVPTPTTKTKKKTKRFPMTRDCHPRREVPFTRKGHVMLLRGLHLRFWEERWRGGL